MKKLLEKLPEYEYVKKHNPSRAILLARKSLRKKTWINFPKFFDLIEEGKDFAMENYASERIEGNE